MRDMDFLVSLTSQIVTSEMVGHQTDWLEQLVRKHACPKVSLSHQADAKTSPDAPGRSSR